MTDIDPTYLGATDVVDLAAQLVAAKGATLAPITSGDHTQVFIIPDGYRLEARDVRQDEDRPRTIVRLPMFGDTSSLAVYLQRFGDLKVTLGYQQQTQLSVDNLTGETVLFTYVIDEHVLGRPSHRTHQASLEVSPTPAAQRWGRALDCIHSQQSLLDLIVDGIGEIATPDGGDLRDLISDLQTSRGTAARSIVRANGSTAIEFAENVDLHAGSGSQVTLPEQIDVVFSPLVGVEFMLGFTIRLRPHISNDGAVSFTLTATNLEEQYSRVIGVLAAELVSYFDVPLLNGM